MTADLVNTIHQRTPVSRNHNHILHNKLDHMMLTSEESSTTSKLILKYGWYIFPSELSLTLTEITVYLTDESSIKTQYIGVGNMGKGASASSFDFQAIGIQGFP